MKKIILTLGTSLVAFSPALVAISCGDEDKGANVQKELDSFINELNNSLVARTDKDIAYLDAKIQAEFTTVTSDDVLTGLGFTKATTRIQTGINSKPISITVKYKFLKTKNEVGQKAEYTLTLRGEANGATAKEISTKVVTSTDNVLAVIDATSMSADQVMAALNSHLKIFMPMKASDLIKDENKATFLTYLRGINTTTPIIFRNGSNEHEMDFSSLQADIDATIDIIENDKHADNKAFAGDIASGNYGQSKNMPAITAYVGATMGTFFAFGKVAGSLTPFYAISEVDYISPSETLPAGNPVEVLAANPFIAMQFKLNTIFEGLTQSNAFQGWETGKDYNLAFSFPTASGAIQSKFRNGTVKSGSLFDATQLAMLTASGLKAGQGSSNFEALFANKFFKFSTDISNTTSIDSTLMQSPSYSTKEDLIAAYSEISESNFANSTYANKLSVIPNNWVQITHGNIDTASMTTNSVMYIAPTAGNANDPIATYYLVFDQTLEVMKTAASITDKYLGFTKSTGEADGLAAVSATGWEFTQNKDLPALASASVKFYRAAASTALSGYFYRASALSTNHNDLVTAWNTYKGTTITPQISSILDGAALESKKSNATWTDLTTEVAAEFGINVASLNIPAGCTLQFTTGLTAANAMAPGATANSKYLNINIRLKKGTEISYAKLNAFRLFEMVA